ncbi:MAG: Transcriptional regulator, TetR family [Pseudoclavibacter caeni]|jgi:AcrR family transcriptional regulator
MPAAVSQSHAAHADTRARLLNAAWELIEEAPGEDISLRSVCDRVGVRLPSLYHHFGSKQGLLDAVTERGFTEYMQAKRARESSGDVIDDLSSGWDQHVAFGLAHPGVYALMYGTVRPGHAPAQHAEPTRLLRELTDRAWREGRLVVPSEQAAAHVLAANVGVTLRQIVLARPDPELSAAVRDGVIAAITGDGSLVERTRRGGDAAAGVNETVDRDICESDSAPLSRTRQAFATVSRIAAAHPEKLGAKETALLIDWLERLDVTA